MIYLCGECGFEYLEWEETDLPFPPREEKGLCPACRLQKETLRQEDEEVSNR